MRAFYGISVSAGIGILVTCFTKAEQESKQRGLVWGTVKDAIFHYKGSYGDENSQSKSVAFAMILDQPKKVKGEGKLPIVHISQSLSHELNAKEGDLLYVSDTRWWLGGLYSSHMIIESIFEDSTKCIQLDRETGNVIIKKNRQHHEVLVEKLY